MPGVLTEINKLAFTIAPVFWWCVYRSIAAVAIGLVWVTVCNILKKYIAPNSRNLLFLFLLFTLVSPNVRIDEDLTLMRYVKPVASISYRYDYDVVQQQVHIATQTDGDDMIDGLTDEQLMEKEQQIYYKSLIFDVALPLIWAGGMAVGGVYLAVSAWRIKKKIRQTAMPADGRLVSLCDECKKQLNTKRKVTIVITDCVSVPAAIGLFRKQILLPSYVQTMDDETVKYIIMHELCHIKDGHLGTIYLSLIVQVVYWFNPLVQYLFSIHRQSMEMMADMAVVEETADAKDYMTAMVNVLAHNTHTGLDKRMLSMADSAKNMKRRIENMKRKDFFEEHSFLVTAVAVLLGTVVQLLFLPVATTAAENPATFDTGIYYGVHAEKPTGWQNASIDMYGNKFSCSLPDNWIITDDSSYETQSGLPLPLSDFGDRLYIVADGWLIGYIGVSPFTPYTEEIPQEIYYQTVWSSLRLGSFRHWDPFTPVTQTATGESGTVDIWYVDDRNMDVYGSMVAAPHYTTNGVLAYDREKQIYIGFGFMPATVSADTAATIAQSIVF